jgi:hypothetical protein
MTHNDTSHFLQASEVDPLGSLGCESETLLEAATFPFSRLILVDCRIGCSLVHSAATVSSIGHRLVCVGEHPCRAFIVAMSLVIACRVGVVVGAGRGGAVGRPHCGKQSTVGGGRWWGICATSGAVVACANCRFVRTVSVCSVIGRFRSAFSGACSSAVLCGGDTCLWFWSAHWKGDPIGFRG